MAGGGGLERLEDLVHGGGKEPYDDTKVLSSKDDEIYDDEMVECLMDEDDWPTRRSCARRREA